ncbi:hypothetical protein ACLOJK_028817 [Asimina triloba]
MGEPIVQVTGRAVSQVAVAGPILSEVVIVTSEHPSKSTKSDARETQSHAPLYPSTGTKFLLIIGEALTFEPSSMGADDASKDSLAMMMNKGVPSDHAGAVVCSKLETHEGPVPESTIDKREEELEAVKAKLSTHLLSQQENASRLSSSKDQLVVLKAREKELMQKRDATFLACQWAYESLIARQKDVGTMEGDMTSNDQELSQLSSSIHNAQQDKASVMRLIKDLQTSKMTDEVNN